MQRGPQPPPPADQCLVSITPPPPVLSAASGLAGFWAQPPLPLSTFCSSLPTSLPHPKISFTTEHRFGTVPALGSHLWSVISLVPALTFGTRPSNAGFDLFS